MYLQTAGILGRRRKVFVRHPLYGCSLSHFVLFCFPLVEFSFVLFCFSVVTGKDGSPTGVVRQGGAHITCSVKHNRSKSHIILHSTEKISFTTKQLFIPTTDFAGSTLWSFITPWSFHLRTRWPPPTSLLLLPD